MIRVCIDTNIWLSGIVYPGGAPAEVVRLALKKKFNVILLQGSRGLLEIRGFRDHSLKGEWKGARSSSLNDQWRVIYYVQSNEVKILVLEITPHDYRKKS